MDASAGTKKRQFRTVADQRAAQFDCLGRVGSPCCSSRECSDPRSPPGTGASSLICLRSTTLARRCSRGPGGLLTLQAARSRKVGTSHDSTLAKAMSVAIVTGPEGGIRWNTSRDSSAGPMRSWRGGAELPLATPPNNPPHWCSAAAERHADDDGRDRRALRRKPPSTAEHHDSHLFPPHIGYSPPTRATASSRSTAVATAQKLDRLGVDAAPGYPSCANTCCAPAPTCVLHIRCSRRPLARRNCPRTCPVFVACETALAAARAPLPLDGRHRREPR
jgi:hypothetical protein